MLGPTPKVGEVLKCVGIRVSRSEVTVEVGSMRDDAAAVSGGGAIGDSVGPVVVSHTCGRLAA